MKPKVARRKEMIELGPEINQEQPITAGNRTTPKLGLLKILIKSGTPGKNTSERKRESKN